MAHPDRTAAPLPTSISEAARQYLALPPTEPTTYPALDDTDGWLKLIEATDAGVAQFLAGYTFPVASDLREISGVNTYVLRADGVPDSDNTPIYLNLHGGGLILGGGELCRAMGSVAAMYSGMITWSVDYRMPPLHPYPAALDDCIAVYRALLEVRDPADIFVGGGSAGGNLAAAADRAGQGRRPAHARRAGAVHTRSRSHRIRRHVPDARRCAHRATQPHAGEPALRRRPPSQRPVPVTAVRRPDPVSPPTFLQSGTRDLFLSNTIRMHRKLLAAGVEAELHVFEAMPHGGFGGTTPEDAELNAAIRGFLDKHRRTA